IVRTVQIYDQPIALIGIYSLFNLPFAIWMLKGFLTEIPLELEDAALVDGASRWIAFWRILLPLAAPGIMAAGIIIFTFAWSEFLFALILTATPNSQTFPVGVQGLVTQFEIIWKDMAASGVIALTGIWLTLRPDGHMDRGVLEADLPLRVAICIELGAVYLLAVAPRAPGLRVNDAMVGLRDALELVAEGARRAGIRVAFEFL